MSSVPLEGVSGPPKADVLFRLDPKGDRQNLAYECLPPASIPKYRSVGRGNAVGLGRAFRILKDSGPRRNVVASGLDSAVRPRHSSWTTESQAAELVRGSLVEGDTITDQDNYVAIRDGFSRKRRPLSGIYTNDESDGERDSATSTTQHVAHITGNDDSSLFQDEVHRRQRELSEKTSRQHHDIEAWLALIELQSEVVRCSEGRHARLTSSQRRTVSDLKISLYRDALSKNEIPTIRDTLVTGLMTEGSKVWENDKQLSEWHLLMEKDISFEISLLYLNFVQTSHQHFRQEQCVAAYQHCHQSELRKAPGHDRDINCLHLVLRATSLIHQSGFTERAIAIWQGLVEVNLFRPSSLPVEQSIHSLEDFWDSEAPRIGEAGARGWSSGSVQPPQPTEDPEMPPINSKNLWDSWYLAEKNAAVRASLPARTLDTTSAEDPYRVILFSDIRDFFFQMSSDDSFHALLDALLCFSGLPLISGSSATFRWRNDPFLCPTTATTMSNPSGGTLAVIPFSGISDPSTLFTTPGPFQAISVANGVSQLRLWPHRVVEQLAMAKPQEEALGSYAIALTLQHSPSAAPKLAKRLIKQNASNLKLYNSYALVESRAGNHDAADNVWKTTLTMNSTSVQGNEISIMQLCRSRIFQVLLQGHLKKVTTLLKALAVDHADVNLHLQTEVGGEYAMARTEHFLQSMINQRLSQPDEMLVLSTELLAILRYCQASRDLEPAFQTYRTVLDILNEMKSTDSCHEVVETLHQRRSQLIDLHISSHRASFEPKQVLRALSESTMAFPNNSIFLTLHTRYQRKYGLMDRLRDIATGASSEPKGPISYIHLITKELSSSEDLGSTEHSIRAAFNRANDEESPVHHCPAIRLAHVRWEISVLQRRSSRPSQSKKQERKRLSTAVHSLHAALRACPWEKAIYMAAFESSAMRDALGSEGLKGIYQTLLERGLRLHVDVSDMVEKIPG
jgi:NRDE-2, necessary for RNA interference